ncbi:class I SAM-dependent RNA methyltransferase [Saccharicrinis sp. FJH54]|uniref:THUMP domain-containing class I SAM-dependent RNA methyltransferase n=1 Tax=Saccharicrinis sp. FJH54 TaxID=3344665 RepID=UPI0035D3DB74
MTETKDFKIVVKTFGGLEEILAGELRDLGAKEVTPLKRAVECVGDNRMLYLANFRCRTALKVLKPVYEFEASDPEQVYHKLRHLDWNEYLTVDKTFSIHSVVHSDNFNHSKFVSYKVKDAIVDFFNKETGKRPSVSLTNPDILFNIHIAGEQCTLSLDSSGESLHKRGWRVEQTEAPINEVLAAGLLMLANWKGQCDLYDPMCGSGTFLVEAAMIATNTAPGLYRQEFAFEKWNDFDADLLDEIYNDDSAEKEFEHKIYGSDVSRIATDKTLKNVKNAGMNRYIKVDTLPFQNLEPKSDKGMIVTNPPYGERLKVHDLNNLYGIIGERLKHHFSGFNAWILGYLEESFYAIGLRPSHKIKLKNGPLDCQFRKYELYEGSKKASKQDRGNYRHGGNRNFNGDQKRPRFNAGSNGNNRFSADGSKKHERQVRSGQRKRRDTNE